ncbi:prophage repressor protein [Klebsiella aerogenes]|uniref:LexA family protein n=1 Tax=Klebsiella aerogenes TaxID=548 RepID=UPI0005EFA665|nr:S24 family peptidase [Klebsiella aerogenes]KJP58486.1 prophage repressor protein [Klebsiella aerogenes]
MNWYDIAKQRIDALGLSQDKLAEHLGVTKGAVSHWLNGRRNPSLQEIGAIFQYLGVTDVKFNPDGTFSIGDVTEQKPVIPQYEYPLISEVQAGSLEESPARYEIESHVWIATSTYASSNSYWLKVKGHSMTAPQGSTPSFPEGMLILVDPDKAECVKSGDFCVAQLNGEVTFKVFQMYGGKPLLEPLNPRYENIPVTDGFRILGKVVKSQWPDETFG